MPPLLTRRCGRIRFSNSGAYAPIQRKIVVCAISTPRSPSISSRSR
jgi:hypothetical protein